MERSCQAMRGLIIRSEAKAYEGLSRLLELLVDPTLSTDAARTMTILSRENDGVITKENFAVTRVSSLSSWPEDILSKHSRSAATV